jgi:uncharacterized membrane protein YhaH (DUF805 family)
MRTRVLGMWIFGMLLFAITLASATPAENGNWNWSGEDVPWGGLWALSGVFCFIWLLGFIIQIIIAVYMYKDAEKRGKSGVLWLIIGLLFGLIGLIVWLIVRPPEPSFYEKKVEKEKKERMCPSCGRAIPFDANICPYCGKRFGGEE